MFISVLSCLFLLRCLVFLLHCILYHQLIHVTREVFALWACLIDFCLKDFFVACIQYQKQDARLSQGMQHSACLQNNVAPHQVYHIRKTFFVQISTVFHINSVQPKPTVNIQELFCSVRAIIHKFSTLINNCYTCEINQRER